MEVLIFASYADGDVVRARSICEDLEGVGGHVEMRCWLRDRDALPGTDLTDQVTSAIERSRVVLLFLSSNVEVSRRVPREVHLAYEQGSGILPVRSEDVPVPRSMRLEVGAAIPIDVFGILADECASRLARAVAQHVGNDTIDLPPDLVEEADTKARLLAGHIRAAAPTASDDAPSLPSPKLVLLTKELRGQCYDLAAETIRIGRAPINEIIIPNATVSTSHCVLRRKSGKHYVRDLHSTNGTRINGERLGQEQEAELQHSDILQVGSIEMMYDTEGTDLEESLWAPTKTGLGGSIDPASLELLKDWMTSDRGPRTRTWARTTSHIIVTLLSVFVFLVVVSSIVVIVSLVPTFLLPVALFCLPLLFILISVTIMRNRDDPKIGHSAYVEGTTGFLMGKLGVVSPPGYGLAWG